MIKIIPAIFSGLVFPFTLIQCTSPTAAVAPKPTEIIAQGSGHSLNQLGLGYTIYLRKCAECHEHRIPGMYLSAERHQLVSGMAHNAGLSNTEEEAVQSYLEAISDR